MITNSEFNLEERLREEMRQVLSNGLKKQGVLLNNLDQIKTVAGWYKEAKENPKEIPNIIVDAALEKLLDFFVSNLGNNIVSCLTVKVHVSREELVIEKVGIDFSLNPYVEFVKKVNSSDIAKVKLTFIVRLSGLLENVKIKKLANYDNYRVSLERFSGSLAVSIMNVEVALIVVPATNVSLPLELLHNQIFEIKNMSFIIHSRNGSPIITSR